MTLGKIQKTAIITRLFITYNKVFHKNLKGNPMSQTNSNWVIANWKMNPVSGDDVCLLMNSLEEKIAANLHLSLPNIAIAPSYVHLGLAGRYIDRVSPLSLSSQNVCGYNAKQGAFTGEVSAHQLKDMQVSSVIIGHSERRQYFGETNEILTQKLECALLAGLTVIFCVGETLEQYENQHTQSVILAQLEALLPFLQENLLDKMIIAYEPVWAIGTGKVPNLAEITQVHQFISDSLTQHNAKFAKTPILYGGSVKGENAKDFAQSPAISGVLVGGASLKADEFWQIIQAFC